MTPTDKPLADVVAELRGLLNKATGAPWVAVPSDDGWNVRRKIGTINSVVVARLEYHEPTAGSNARLVAALRNNADLLLTAAACGHANNSQATRGESISLTDPAIIIAGIRQFGLAPDGSDLSDLERAFASRDAELAQCRLDGEFEELAHISRTLLAACQSERGALQAELARCRAELESERQRHADAEIKYHETLEFIRATNVVKGLNHLANMTIAQTSTEGKLHD